MDWVALPWIRVAFDAATAGNPRMLCRSEKNHPAAIGLRPSNFHSHFGNVRPTLYGLDATFDLVQRVAVAGYYSVLNPDDQNPLAIVSLDEP